MNNDEPKSGFKTSEFWMAIAAGAATILGAIQGALSPETAPWLLAVVSAGYSIARGIAKKS